MDNIKSFTVNTQGDNVKQAKLNGYHAYYASGVTAIEVKAIDKRRARLLVNTLGLKVLYIFE